MTKLLFLIIFLLITIILIILYQFSRLYNEVHKNQIEDMKGQDEIKKILKEIYDEEKVIENKNDTSKS